MYINEEKLKSFHKHYRIHLINGITGTKAANLIATKNKSGLENVAVFSSVIHLGSEPALIGFVLRQGKVERHTFENIIETKYYTINHINDTIYTKAHHSSAKFPRETSEFLATGLNSVYLNNFYAPYVEQSLIKFGLELQEVIEIKSNETKLIVGKITDIHLPSNCVHENGFVDLQNAGSMSIGGLDAYYNLDLQARLSYAETFEIPKPIDFNNNGRG
ncbi:MAG: hypothetical protein RLZZ414_1533 [Bacteroidota bacterium]|jgi:flavin reductase (DIM6/NTAB) family NADH-FMN oxidoreductase RutF